MKNSPVIIEQEYPVPIDKVWNAITDKEEMKQWYFTIHDFILKKGSTFNFYESEETKQYHHRCLITEIKPKTKFQHTWTYPDNSHGQSLLTWMLEPLEEGTRVTIIHEGVDSFRRAGRNFSRESFKAGWKEILGKSLKNYLINSQ